MTNSQGPNRYRPTQHHARDPAPTTADASRSQLGHPKPEAHTQPALYDRITTLVIDPDPHARRLIASLLARCFPGLNIHLGTQPTPDAARDHLDCHACILGFAPVPTNKPTTGRDTEPNTAQQQLQIEAFRSFRSRHPSAILIACLTNASTTHANALLTAGAHLVCRHDAPGDLPKAVRHLQRAFEHRLLHTTPTLAA